jgi:membrane protein XagC
MGAAVAIGAPVAVVLLALVYRRRPLIIPAAVFVATAIAATAICVASGFFGDPTAIILAAPVLAATAVIRVPVARERLVIVIGWLVLGWLGGLVSLALVDPITVNRLHLAFGPGASERLDTIAAGGASLGRDGVLADTDNAPALVLGRGHAHGISGPESEAFTLAMLFARVETPLIAVPDPQSTTGANDRLDKAFPSLFRHGLAGYRVIYQNNTWRLFAKIKEASISGQ